MPPPIQLLVVHGDETLSRATKRLLSQHAYRIVVATRGADALHRIDRETPHIVLLATSLPDMDGYDVLRAIRRENARVQPVVIMTGDGEDPMDHYGRRADGYLAWPASDEDLLAHIRVYAHQHARIGRLRQSEAQMVRAQRIANTGSWEFDVVRDQLTWSDEIFRIFGYERDSFVPSVEAFYASVHEEDRVDMRRAQEMAMSGERTLDHTHRIVRPDGDVRWVRELGEVMERNAKGEATWFIGVVMDVTERHERERNMRLQRAALESAANSIAITDSDGCILWVNQAFAKSYGYTEAELTGRKPGDVLKSGVHDEEFYRNMWDTILSGRVWSGEVVNKRRDGTLLTEELTITPVCDDQGRVANFVAIKQDITERRRLEKQFLRSQRLESIGTLAGGIAHDLNNLLAPIVMGIDLLAQREAEESVRAVIRNMGRSAARGTSLVRQVLSFARGADGARVPVFLDQVVEEVVSMARTGFPKNIRLQTLSSEGIWPLIGDRAQVNQVILNLTVNARDAMPNGGRVRLAVQNVTIDAQYASMQDEVESGEYVRLEITDEGCGMSAEVKERIFEPFYSTKDVGQGTGLGLSTVLGIVRSHGGFINVYTEAGKGTTFKVYFPAQQGADLPEPEPEVFAHELRGRGETVLVVDDELSILTNTKHTLESYGYRVLTAEDGAQAIGVFAMNKADVDVTMTDMTMPVMDGPALIKAIRRIDPGARIMAVSGLQGGVNVARAAQVGVKDFLEKPFTAGQLLRALRDALERSL